MEMRCTASACSTTGSSSERPCRAWHRMQLNRARPGAWHPTATWSCSFPVRHKPCSTTCSALRKQNFGDPRLTGGNPRWWEELEDGTDEDHQVLTPDEVDERVEEAAAFISVLDDVTPLDPRSYNAFAEVWTRISRIPPHARCRLIKELDEGSLRSLWRASMARYVLPDDRAMHLLAGFSVLDDFPREPGQVVTFEGCAERWTYDAPTSKFSVDGAMQSRYPRSAPWLKPNQGRMKTTRKLFKQHFFLHPRTGVLHSRVDLQQFGLFGAWSEPLYCRVRPILTLTPLESDAGADMTLDYQVVRSEQDLQHGLEVVELDGVQGGVQGDGIVEQRAAREVQMQMAAEELLLLPADLPNATWPKPDPDAVSPFSRTERDFVRVAGPGVYVGCAYERDATGRTNRDACVHFVLVRKTI